MTREEAIKTIMSANVWTDEEREALGILIPELAEDKDEKIRKELVAFFIEVRNRNRDEGYWHGLKVADILAYLEKQKVPNSEWSEEDEKVFADIISDIEYKKDLEDAELADFYNKQIHFLKSLHPKTKEDNL